MLQYRWIPESNIVEFTIDGAITRRQFADLVTEVESKIEDFGSVDLLEEIRSIGNIPPSVLWADLRWAVSHWKKIGRVAVVCDKDWVGKAVDVMQPLVAMDVRHFELTEKEEARRWLRGGID
ncbi:MAG: STAS/SEC14 domain-containing protein [Woeseia sp.]